MRRTEPTTLFDVEVDDLTQEFEDLADEFWGTSRSWPSGEHRNISNRTPAVRSRDLVAELADRDTTGSIRAIRDGFAALRPRTSDTTGEVARTRRHGGVSRTDDTAGAGRREATLGELAAGRSDHDGWVDDPDDWDDWDDWATGVDPRPARGAVGGHGDPSLDRDEDGETIVPLSPVGDRWGLGAVDPVLVKVGIAIAVLVLLVPLVLALRPERSGALPEQDLVEDAGVGAGAPPPAGSTSAEPAPAATAGAPAATGDAATTSSDGAGEPAAAASTVASGEPVVEPMAEAPATAPAGDGPASSIGAEADAAVDVDVEADAAVEVDAGGGAEADAAAAAAVTEEADRVVCPQTYTAGAGDSWYRIADGAGISPTALLAENGASLSTTIFPGDEVCLPEGASMPTPPTTAAATTAPTTTAPSTTSDSSSSDSSTTAPSTTEASTTTAAPTTTSYVSASEAAQIIRDVWPDDLEERALEVAWRESRHRPDADNGWCCHGLFQIYYSVHADWLQDFGVYQLSDLYDARKNAEAAYALYQGAGGWGPWGG